MSVAQQPDRVVDIRDRALDHLRVIRSTMERSSRFTAVPGWGGVVMGVLALITGAWVDPNWAKESWLVAWLSTALIAATVGAISLRRKASRSGEDLSRAVPRRFALGMVPALLSGLLISIALVANGAWDMLPGVWMLAYGSAVVAAGAFSVRPVPLMGGCFILTGGVALFAPAAIGHYLLAGAFGFLHIAFGLYIARRHGG